MDAAEEALELAEAPDLGVNRQFEAALISAQIEGDFNEMSQLSRTERAVNLSANLNPLQQLEALSIFRDLLGQGSDDDSYASVSQHIWLLAKCEFEMRMNLLNSPIMSGSPQGVGILLEALEFARYLEPEFEHRVRAALRRIQPQPVTRANQREDNNVISFQELLGLALIPGEFNGETQFQRAAIALDFAYRNNLSQADRFNAAIIQARIPGEFNGETQLQRAEIVLDFAQWNNLSRADQFNAAIILARIPGAFNGETQYQRARRARTLALGNDEVQRAEQAIVRSILNEANDTQASREPEIGAAAAAARDALSSSHRSSFFGASEK